MCDRITRVCAAVCAGAVIVMMSTEARARQGISANDPVAIGGGENETAPASPPLLTIGPAGSHRAAGDRTAGNHPKPEPKGPAVDEESLASGDVTAAAPSIKTAIEKKSLGKANSALSARPADATLPDNAGVLDRIDPRSNDITRVLGALAIVVGLLLLVRTVLRRMGGVGMGMAPGMGRPSGVVEILARFPAGRGQQFILLKLLRRIILLHQSGSSVTTLTEITDPEEAAALLSRMEAGASGRSALKFKATLREFEADHQSLLKDDWERPRTLPAVETEIVDLTRTGSRSFARLLGLTRKAAP